VDEHRLQHFGKLLADVAGMLRLRARPDRGPKPAERAERAAQPEHDLAELADEPVVTPFVVAHDR